jgi:hypothetical protein
VLRVGLKPSQVCKRKGKIGVSVNLAFSLFTVIKSDWNLARDLFHHIYSSNKSKNQPFAESFREVSEDIFFLK